MIQLCGNDSGKKGNTMGDNRQTQQEKREARRRRRRRNQIMAYITVIVLILASAAGIVFAVGKLNAEKEESPDPSQENQDILENILSSEETIQTPEPTPEPVAELTYEQKLDEIVDAAIEVMPLEDKVAGLFIVTPESITGVRTALKAGDGTKEALSQYAVGGLVYFSQNIQSEEQLTEMLANTQIYTKYPIFLAVDEEGGTVARVADAGLGTKVDGAQAVGASGNADNAYIAGQTIGADLAGLGFNLDFAPVADLANTDQSIMAQRAYGSDAQTTIPYVSSMIMGLSEQGITTCLKHFPGIGSSTQDTHNGLVSTSRTLEEFRAEEFTVFKAGIDAGADMVMIGHISAPGLTGDNDPCTFSPEVVTDILRNELGFRGVVITDALNMKAVSDYYGADEAAVFALRAGCDMLLMPEDFEKAYNGVLQAVQDGTISEERIDDSLRRIYRIKYADKVE